jgi:hypothetical protein
MQVACDTAIDLQVLVSTKVWISVSRAYISAKCNLGMIIQTQSAFFVLFHMPKVNDKVAGKY